MVIDPSKIDIVRDSYGIPHIFAKTDPEVAYGLMWAAAEDDFDTMQFLLMASKGRMGVHNGVEGAQIDYAVQLMGLHEHVEKHYEAEVPDDFKRLLEAACMGANAYAAAHPEEVWYAKAFPVTPQEIIHPLSHVLSCSGLPPSYLRGPEMTARFVMVTPERCSVC